MTMMTQCVSIQIQVDTSHEGEGSLWLFGDVDKIQIKKHPYHFFHKLVMNGVFQEQSASCDAVLSLVKEH